MTIAEYTQQLQQRLKEHATRLAHDYQDRVLFMGKMVSFMQGLTADLQQYTYKYTFADTQEEIAFFKEQKPVLLSQYFFYKKSLSVLLYDSYKDYESKKLYYNSVLSQLSDFLRKNSRFHLYCVTGQTHLDAIYFTRGARPDQGLIDPQFSTGYDIRLAKLLANELLRNDLSLNIERLSVLGKNSGVNWTGKKSEAVELIFALQASGSINGGQVDVKTLVVAFEQFFNISFGNYYDFIKKIRMRKKGQTNFLDTLRNRFIARLDQMDE